MWEVERPVRAPRTETFHGDPRVAECQAGLDLVESIIPGLTAFHELGAELAREEVRIFNGDFKWMIYPLQFEVPGYDRWLFHEADPSVAPARPATPPVRALEGAVGAEVAGAHVEPAGAARGVPPTPSWCRRTATR